MKRKRTLAKMLWRKTRDLIVETVTIVKGIEVRFDTFDTKFEAHIKDEDEKIDSLHKVIVDCHESCPEKENFDRHTEEQNGTLKRMEKKYDNFFSEHTEVKKIVEAMKTAKKTKKETFVELGRIITIVCLVVGAWFAYMKYCDSKKPASDVSKIEKMLEKLLER